MLVISSSSLKAFKDCRKSYDLMYERLLNPTGTSTAAVDDGTSFHEWIAEAARGREIDGADEMAEVARVYLEHNPLPEGILMVEEPFFVELIPGVVVRCTFDLVYDTGHVIRGRDYKTFGQAATMDLDLDFQGRFYIGALQRLFPGRYIEFEYVNVRRTPPGWVHNKKGDIWTPEECYNTVPLILAQHEIDTLWKETQWVAQDLIDTKQNGHWYRQDKKGWSGCSSCFARNLCKAEVQQGELDEQTIQLLSTPRESLRIPDAGYAGLAANRADG